MTIELSKKARETIIASWDIRENDFGVFVSLLGKEPAPFFEGKDWRGVDFRKTDIRCLSFVGADLRLAIVDHYQLVHLENCTGVSTVGLVVKDPIVSWKSVGTANDERFAGETPNQHIPDRSLRGDFSDFAERPEPFADWTEVQDKILSDFRDGRRPDEVIIDKYIRHTASSNHVMAVLQVLRDIDYSPSVHQLNMLLTRCSTFDDAMNVLDMYQDYYDTAPNIDTFTRLISRTRSYEKALPVLDIMRRHGVRAGRMFFNRLIVRTPNLAAAKDVMSKMKDESVQPSVATYNTLISKCASFEDARACMASMRNDGFRANRKTYNRLLAKTEYFQEAIAIVDQLSEQGLHPDEETIRLLVRRVKSGSQAVKIFYLAKEAYLEISKSAYEYAVNLAIGGLLDQLIGLAREDGWDVINVLGQKVESSEDVNGGNLRLVPRNPLGV